MYTKENLKQLNALYDRDHIITDQDVFVANMYVFAIEKSRSRLGRPQPGDILLIDGKMAHIEEVEHDEITVCQNPYTPFISCKFVDSVPRVSMNTSGGPWTRIATDSLVSTKDTKKKTFCFFGHCGPVGNGAIDIEATVNIYSLKK